jgi:hypothetical protein
MRVGALGPDGRRGCAFRGAGRCAARSRQRVGTAAATGPAPIASSVAPAPPGAQTPAALAAVLNAPADATIPDAFVHGRDPRSPETIRVLPRRHRSFSACAGTRRRHRSRPPRSVSTRRRLAGPRNCRRQSPQTAEAALSPFGLPCGLDVTADASDAAMIALGVAAPCHPEAVVTITHSGMTIAARNRRGSVS